jgi:hypothetical protein
MTGALSYHAAWVESRLKRYRRTPQEVQMEHLPEVQCRSVGPREDYCVLKYGHRGPCSWRRKR